MLIENWIVISDPQGTTAPDYYAPNVTQPIPAADPSVCAPRGTLPTRPTNVAKTPHRKNVGTSSQSQRNRTASSTGINRVTSTTTTTTTTTGRPSVTERSAAAGGMGGSQAAAVWGQGVSLNHEKPPPSLVMIETPLNDIIHLHNHSSASGTQETTASQELSSRRASVLLNSSGSSAAAAAAPFDSFTIILIALSCTYCYNHLWASCNSSGRKRS